MVGWRERRERNKHVQLCSGYQRAPDTAVHAAVNTMIIQLQYPEYVCERRLRMLHMQCGRFVMCLDWLLGFAWRSMLGPCLAPQCHRLSRSCSCSAQHTRAQHHIHPQRCLLTTALPTPAVTVLRLYSAHPLCPVSVCALPQHERHQPQPALRTPSPSAKQPPFALPQ